MEPPYFGKYRGTVTDNNDPNNLGRILATVDGLDAKLSWATPCVPYAGKGLGFFALPPIEARVWIEFEGGELSSPIWSGCFWDDKYNVMPPSPAKAGVHVLKTQTGTLTVDDTNKSIAIESTFGIKIELKSASITISNGQAKIELASKSVKINDDGLEVLW